MCTELSRKVVNFPVSLTSSELEKEVWYLLRKLPGLDSGNHLYPFVRHFLNSYGQDEIKHI